MSDKQHPFSIWKLYLLVTTLVGLIGCIVAFGGALYSGVERALISNDQYVMGQRYYELEQCEYANMKGEKQVERTDKEIATCKEEKTEQVLMQRAVEMKRSIGGGIVRGIIFLVLFIVYYPKFKQKFQS